MSAFAAPQARCARGRGVAMRGWVADIASGQVCRRTSRVDQPATRRVTKLGITVPSSRSKLCRDLLRRRIVKSKLRQPRIPLVTAIRQGRSAPRAMGNREDRCAAVVNPQPIRIELLMVTDQNVRAVRGIRVHITALHQLRGHGIATVNLGEQHVEVLGRAVAMRTSPVGIDELTGEVTRPHRERQSTGQAKAARG